ncbi:hypothetical protein ACGFYT_02660 [Streptomyces sp. NPDC048208]|uniref:hypothetical protein n=1 Tax=unclassified Streptomyces TaxID=2593676 RepID=UPI00137122E6|nr:hypothetical protein [Streptomyces sp. SID4982]MYS13780.1 hypothetical protein [Streptomyces sp. SID4982]
MAHYPTEPDEIEGPDDGAQAPIDVEAPEHDAAEQRVPLTDERDEPLSEVDPDRGSEGDLIEQARVVGPDEEDYR